MMSVQVHQIKLNPVSSEFEWAAGFFGTIFNVSDFACLLDDGCLSFATCHDGVPDNKTAPTPTSLSFSVGTLIATYLLTQGLLAIRLFVHRSQPVLGVRLTPPHPIRHLSASMIVVSLKAFNLSIKLFILGMLTSSYLRCQASAIL